MVWEQGIAIIAMVTAEEVRRGWGAEGGSKGVCVYTHALMANFCGCMAETSATL